MRKFLVPLILLLGITYLLTSYSQLENVLSVFRSGLWSYIWIAILLEIIWMLNVSASYHALYRILGLRESFRRLFYLTTAGYFVNVVAPGSGTVPVVALLINDGQKRGHSTARVMIAWALNILFEFVGLLVVATLGLGVLARRNNIHWPEILTSVLLLMIALGIAAMLYLTMLSAPMLGKVLAWGTRIMNRFGRALFKREYMPEGRAFSFASEATDGLSELRRDPRKLIVPTLLALSNKGLLLLIMLMMFLAFNVEWSAGSVIGGLGIGYLSVVMSPTPGGIGIAEGVFALTLRSLTVPLDAATVITLGFRGITFWLPLFVGMFTFRMGSRLDARRATRLEKTNSP